MKNPKIRKTAWLDLLQLVTGKTRHVVKTQMYRKGWKHILGMKKYLDWFYRK